LIEPVPKGISGADVIQKMRNNSGQIFGKIIWESKQTKTWSDGWIQKLKDDQKTEKAREAVIVTEVLPKGITNFGFKNGVWITNFRFCCGLAAVLRTNVENLARMEQATVGKGSKMEVLYTYLSGAEFRQRVMAIADAFAEMKHDLDKEREQAKKSWAKREEQIQRVKLNMLGMRGDMRGLGASMQPIPALEAGEDNNGKLISEPSKH
jgi:hypothetical protein